MAAPFFSGGLSREPDPNNQDTEGLTDIQVYNMFMGAYPAYTIEIIENELSWRTIKLLMDCWESEPPDRIRLTRIENMIAGKLGVRFSDTKVNKEKAVSVIGEIEKMGWSA